MKHLTLYFLLIAQFAFAQKPQVSYKKNYIPDNLDQAMAYFDFSWTASSKTKFKQLTEAQMIARCHLGFGMWLRNSWGLWRGDTPIYKYFDKLGISYPEDISSIILVSYHRYLNKRKIKLKQQIAETKAYWKKVKQKQLAEKRQKMREFHVQDTVEFAYKYDFTSTQQEQAYDSLTCVAQGIVIAKDTIKFKLQIKLIESCSSQGIVIEKQDILEKRNGKWVVIEKDRKRFMKVGQTLWMPYDLWEPKE